MSKTNALRPSFPRHMGLTWAAREGEDACVCGI